MDSFLQQTARSIIDSMDWKQLSRTTLVLPSHRAGLVLKDEILRLQQERHAQAIWAPQVQTLTQLQDSLSPLYPEDELFTIVRLYKIYRNIQNNPSNQMSLDLFYNWGRQMVADFTNIDASMPAQEVPNFFENTIAAHELEQWRLDPETEERLRALIHSSARDFDRSPESVHAQYEVLWQQLYTMYQGLRTELLAEQKGYPGMRQRAVLEHWEDERIQSQIRGRKYIFVGFNYLLPVERDLMLRLRDAGQARFYWDFVPDFETNEKAFSFAKQNAELLGNTECRVQNTDRFTPKQVTLISCVSKEAQAQYVHRWLQENYTTKGQKVGVVISDETMLEPVIYALPAITIPGQDTPEPINITKGFPLRNTAIYARVMAWLNDNARGRADECVTPEIIDRLLEELFLRDTEVPESRDAESPLSWQELLILESEYQVRKIANQMRLLLTNGLGDVPFTLKLLRLLMRRTMEAVTMPFHGEPVTDIQVMGVLETRLLDFDKLLILNVEEGVLPQKQPDSSFIPFYLRKTYHMQTSDERATVYAYNFFRLLSRAGHTTLLYATAETSESGKGMSRFIMQMLYSPDFIVEKRNLEESDTLSDSASHSIDISTSSILSTLTKDEQGMLVKPDGKRYRLSPSALNTYITCPYSFYLQYILGLRPKEDEQVLFEANTLGTFVHYTIEYIYRVFFHCDNHDPVPVSPDEIEAIRTDETQLDEALMAAYAKMNEESETTYIPEHHAGENVVIKGYVANILERDREDAKKGLQIYLLEQDRLFALPIDGIGEILTGGKIDRLDIYGEGADKCLRVVDYKSGGYNDKTHATKMSANWEDIVESEEKSYVRQTLIYSHAVLAHERLKLPIEPNLFFCRRKLTDIVTTIDVENQPVHDYAAVASQFTDALQAKVKTILTATEFAQCDESKCPSYCPFFDLCGRKAVEY